MVFYRPHETWTTRADWRTQLPGGEDVTCKLRSSRSNDISVIDGSSNISERLLHRSHNLCKLRPRLYPMWHTLQNLPPKVFANGNMRLMARLHTDNG